MSNNLDSLSKSNPSKLICVISPCDYLYQGYKLISNMEGIETKRVIFKDNAKETKYIDIFNQNRDASLSVCFDGDICSILRTLKECISFINKLKRKGSIRLYSCISVSWLYRMMRGGIHDDSFFESIQVVDISHGAQRIFSDTSILLKEAANIEEKKNGKIFEGFTARELDVLNYHYHGISVKDQSVILNLSIKTIYTHRKKGMHKLDQFLNIENMH